MKKLLIVESPAKIKTISKFLGPDFKIMSTLGHVKDLPQRELGIELGTPIKIDYVPLVGKKKVIDDIVKQAKVSEEIYLAPDPDREGEIIAWHIGEEIAKKVKNKDHIHRITFNEITQPAIVEALKNQTTVDMKKVAAQQARRVLDRWVGYEVSPILWRKIQKGLSAGRVQSVALKLIVDREKEIKGFKTEEYWTIEGLFSHKKEQFSATLTHIDKKKVEIKNKEQSDTICESLKKESFSISSIEDKERKKNPLPPFMTSSLQQAAYNRLGFPVKKTMQIAQKLYEGVQLGDGTVALITYMRTDSLRLSETALKQARSFIKENFGNDYLPSKAQVYAKGKKAQDAHEAIRPIDVTKAPQQIAHSLSADEAKLYTLIWQRFVASQMMPAVYAQRKVTLQGGKFIFNVTGSTLIFDGFLKIYFVEDDEKEEKVKLPGDLKEKDSVILKKIDPKQHFTQPPPRYTEGSLVKTLEKEGIGRPSTYATILSTIRKREYTELDKKKHFVPTPLGIKVTDMLEINLPKIMNLQFTALMEEDLDKIADGEMDRDKLLHEFYGEFSKDLDKFLGHKHKVEETDITCPQCKEHKLVIRFGKAGEFAGCAGFPACKFTSNFIREDDGSITLVEAEKPKTVELTCPQCGKQLEERMGKYGKFIACPGYPECKYIHKEKANFKCPTCKKGDVVKKSWRGGTFWGCDNYPKCRFAIFGDIEETPCPQCNMPFLVKKTDKDGTVTIYCWNKECNYKK
ncbi:MAG: topoisomerase protein [candidate division TM6 bacterium GW2011_GWE2_36_25]|nr:MAG: topoisomerase protein [candidate division TM6 bacterium GW2011_GWF2_36_131]KKQ02523.1 MAG: topoisomerase protein [candidate division TM6 bacterium GW2011_GWE2_36_25]KKQ19269.1 MAG: topoisomerase protein [candidate division TM6 bacterium GW2011_GWA2_36_9]